MKEKMSILNFHFCVRR